MKYIHIYFTLLYLFLSMYSYGQKITGTIVDENKKSLEYASVLLLSTKDSTMVDFTHTDRQGKFGFNVSTSRDYIIQITYLSYQTMYRTIVRAEADIDVGEIIMTPDSKLLDVVEIKDYVHPMTFGKDTIQYNAAAFKIKAGDMAEDLLKKLPGLEIERDGSVKAFGEKVENVLVDGKTFFGKDTKIATKNLDADAIEKVQVFDKKSDQADFTGIDDGHKERSINLKLKPDKKTGYFGTTEVAGGSDSRFKARANINRFTPNLRSSFIGMANNINEQNFSIRDYIDFMGGIGALTGSSGGRVNLNLNENLGLPIGLDNNQGVQKSYAGGINLSSHFSSFSTLEASLFGHHFNNELTRNAIRENLLPQNRFRNTSETSETSNNTNGSFTLKWSTRIDSTQQLTIRANGSLGKSRISNSGKSEVFNDVVSLLNESKSTSDYSGNNASIFTNILWQKKWNKAGRNVALNFQVNNSSNPSDHQISSIFQIYFPFDQVNGLIQDQLGINRGFFYNVEASFTEALGKKKYLELKASTSNQNNNTQNIYFDIIQGISMRNDLLSTLYQRDYILRNIGLYYNMSSEKSHFSFGARFKKSTLAGLINESQTKVGNRFQALLPSLNYQHRFGVSENLNFDYFSELNEPSIQQLQPFVDNSNPLSIYIGNPSLRPEQMHRAQLSYMRYNAFDFTMLYINIQSVFTGNKIIEALSVDSALVRSFTPVNTKGESLTNIRIEYDTPIRPLKIKARAVVKGNYHQGISVINDENNDFRRISYQTRLSLENRHKDIFDILLGYKIQRSVSNLSNIVGQNQSFLEKTIFAELGVNLKDWISVKSNFDYLSYTQSFTSRSTVIPLWTASISTYITKNKKIRASISCFDILNKNKGITAQSQLNFTDVIQTNVLGRYVLIGFSYNIKGFAKKNDGVVHISNID